MAAQSDLDAEVERLTAAHTAAERRQAKAEATAEAAAAERDRLLARLRDEFGCDSVEAAEAVLAELQTELGSEVERVRVELEAAGG